MVTWKSSVKFIFPMRIPSPTRWIEIIIVISCGVSIVIVSWIRMIWNSAKLVFYFEAIVIFIRSFIISLTEHFMLRFSYLLFFWNPLIRSIYLWNIFAKFIFFFFCLFTIIQTFRMIQTKMKKCIWYRIKHFFTTLTK